MNRPMPPADGRLLVTYPPAWRREHETVVLGTLLEADEAAGRSGPSRRDRMGFLLGGMLVRLPHGVRPSRVAPLPIVDAGWQLFDQSNGFDAQTERSESEQVKLNVVQGRSGGEQTAASMPRNFPPASGF